MHRDADYQQRTNHANIFFVNGQPLKPRITPLDWLSQNQTILIFINQVCVGMFKKTDVKLLLQCSSINIHTSNDYTQSINSSFAQHLTLFVIILNSTMHIVCTCVLINIL